MKQQITFSLWKRVLLLLVLLVPLSYGFGQTSAKRLATLVPGNYADVENIENVNFDNNSSATLFSSGGLAIGLVAKSSYIDLSFNSSPAAADNWLYIELKSDGKILDNLLGGSLGSVVTGLLNPIAGGVPIIDLKLTYANGLGSIDFSTKNYSTLLSPRFKVFTNGQGNTIMAINPVHPVRDIKITNKTDFVLLGLLNPINKLEVFKAYTIDSASQDDCGKPIGTSFDATGLSLSVLGGTDQKLGNAIDSGSNAMNTASTLKSTAVASVNLGSTLSQYFYFSNSSTADSNFNITLGNAGSGVLNLGLLGNIKIIAYDGYDQSGALNKVDEITLDSGVVSELNLLYLLSKEKATIPIALGKAFDVLEVRITTAVGVGLLSEGLKIYDVERFGGEGSSCENPLLTKPAPTQGPLKAEVCANTVLSSVDVAFADYSVDGNNESAAILYATGSGLLGAASKQGSIELAYANSAATSAESYIRFDAGEDINVRLLGGTLGALLDVVGNLLVGDFYFTVDVMNGSSSVLSGSSNNSFKDANGKIGVVQDNQGRYYIRVAPGVAYTSVKVTAKVGGSLLGSNELKELKIYNMCYESDIDACGAIPFTSFEGSGLKISLLELNNQALENAIDVFPGTAPAQSHMDTASLLKSGGILDLGLGGSLSQMFYFSTVSAANATFNIKIGPGSSVLNAELLGGLEVYAYKGDQEVYRRPLSGGLINDLDILEVLQQGPATLVFAPGREFDRVEVRLSSLVNLGLIGSGVKIYDITRYGDKCPNPLVKVDAPTETPFVDAACASVLGDFENVDFATNAVDGNNETYAIMYANTPGLLGTQSKTNSVLELKYDQAVTSGAPSYIRIDTDEALLDKLVGGTLGDILGSVTDLLLGDFYFTVSVLNNGNPVVSGSSVNKFSASNGAITLVQEDIGRNYIAVAPGTTYDAVKIELFVGGALLNSGATKTMSVYDMCHELSTDPCIPAKFTSFDISGLNLSVNNLGNAGVTNPHHAISGNSSNYSLINTGTVAVGTKVWQTVYFNTPSEIGDQLDVRIQLKSPSTLDVALLGTIKVKTYLVGDLKEEFTLSQAIIKGLDVLSLLGKGSPTTLTFDTQEVFDRVVIENTSTLNVSLADGVRLFSVKRSNDVCKPEKGEHPFIAPKCATEYIDGENIDFAENMFDDDFNSYATISSGAGFLLGLGDYEGSVHLGYDHVVKGGTTSYMRIDFEGTEIDKLLGGSLGNLVGDLVGGLLTGNHYFTVEALDASQTTIMKVSTTSDANESSLPEGSVKVVIDALGRHYLAITPKDDYKSIRITDKTKALVGITAAEGNSMNVYGLCYETTDDTCFASFATSYEFKGLNLSVDPLSGAGVTYPERAIDNNSTHHSSLSLGTLGVGSEVQQWVYFNSVSEANEEVNFKFKTGGGAVDLSILGGISISAYLGDTHVQTLDWKDTSLIDGLTVASVLSNGGMADVDFKVTNGKFDRVMISLKSLVSVTVISSLEVYNISRVCAVKENDMILWKSYKVDGDSSVTVVGGGETVEYTIHVGNTGFGPLSSYTISDVLPAGVTHVSGGTLANGTVTFDFAAQTPSDNLLPGAVHTYTFTVLVNDNLDGIDYIKNIATGKMPFTTKEWESFPPVDNTDPKTPDVSKDPGTILTVGKNYDFTIEKTGEARDATGNVKSNPNVAQPGDQIVYSIKVTNTGRRDLTDVVVQDIVQNDAEASVIVFTGAPWTGTGNGDVYTATIPLIPAGQSVTLNITVTVDVANNNAIIVNKANATYEVNANTTITKETEYSIGSFCNPIDASAIEFVQAELCAGIEGELEVKIADTYPTVLQNVVFTWYDNAAFTGTPVGVGNKIDVTLVATGKLYVKVDALGFCFSGPAFEVDVVVNPTPVKPTLAVDNSFVCFGSEALLTAPDYGVGATYKWYLDGNEVSDSSNNTNPDAKAYELRVNKAGSYTVSVSTGGCFSLQSDAVAITTGTEINLEVDGALQYSIPFAGSTAETSLQLPLASTDTPGAVLTWYDAQGTVIDPTQKVIFTAAGTYTFYVEAKDGSCNTYEQIIVTVYDMSDCFDQRVRVYADADQGWGSIITGGVANRPNAIDKNPKTYSTITTGLGLLGIGTTWQNLYFHKKGDKDANGNQKVVSAGTPVTIKLGKEYAGLVVAGGLSVVGIGTNGLDIGVIKPVKGGLLDLLAADNVVEFTFVPSTVTGPKDYIGVRISQGSLVGVAQLAKLYGAYYHREATSADALCTAIDSDTKESVLDVLHGVQDIGLGVASATASVSSPWNAVDNDPDSYATISRGVAVLNVASLTVVFKQTAMPGDELHIVTEVPGNPILSLELIKGYTIQRFMGDIPVGPALDGGKIDVLDLKLLGLGYQNKSKIIVAPFDQPYDRVKISYGSVVGVLGDFTRIYDVDVVPTIDSIVPDHNGNYNKHICEGGLLDLELPDDCTSFIVYKDENKTDFYTQIGQEDRFQTFDVSDLEAGKTHIIYVQSTRNGCAVGPLVPINLTISEAPEFKEYVLNGTDVLTGADANGNFEIDLPTRSQLTIDARSTAFDAILDTDEAVVAWEIQTIDANGIESWIAMSNSKFATVVDGQLQIDLPAMGIIDGVDYRDTVVKVRATLGKEYTPWANITPPDVPLDPVIKPYTCFTTGPEISIKVGNGKKSAVKSNLNVTQKIK